MRRQESGILSQWIYCISERGVAAAAHGEYNERGIKSGTQTLWKLARHNPQEVDICEFGGCIFENILKL